MVTLVIGAPGAGKGTLIGKLPAGMYTTIETGKRLRYEVEHQTKLGKIAGPIMKAGKLVSDDLINPIVLGAIEEATENGENVILDGYPRTVPQAEAMLQAGIIPDLLIYLEISKEEVEKRAADRQICSKCGQIYTKEGDFHKPKVAGICDDCGGELKTRDDEAKISERYEQFEKETLPVVVFLKNHGVNLKIIRADSDPEIIEKVFKSAIQRVPVV